MSRPKTYWYGIVRKMLMQYPKLKDEKSIQSGIFVKGVEKTDGEVLKLDNGEERLKAVRKFYFEKKQTAAGIAFEMHYGERTIQRWVSDYTYRVGKNVGF